MKIYQAYVRLTPPEGHGKNKIITSMKWYPVTEHYGMCGRIINNKGEDYLIDMDVVHLSSNWEVKVVEVTL